MDNENKNALPEEARNPETGIPAMPEEGDGSFQDALKSLRSYTSAEETKASSITRRTRRTSQFLMSCSALPSTAAT